MSHETTLIEELIQETQKQPQISSYIIPRGLTFFFFNFFFTILL